MASFNPGRRLAENFPALWISKIHIILPVMLLIYILEWAFAYVLPLTTNSNNLYIILGIFVFAGFIAILRSQVLSFHAELRFAGHFYIFLVNIFITFLLAVAYLLPFLVLKSRADNVSVSELKRDILIIRAAQFSGDEIALIKNGILIERKRDSIMNGMDSLEKIAYFDEYSNVTRNSFLEDSRFDVIHEPPSKTDEPISTVDTSSYVVPVLAEDSIPDYPGQITSDVPDAYTYNEVVNFIYDKSPRALDSALRTVPAILLKYDFSLQGQPYQIAASLTNQLKRLGENRELFCDLGGIIIYICVFFLLILNLPIASTIILMSRIREVSAWIPFIYMVCFLVSLFEFSSNENLMNQILVTTLITAAAMFILALIRGWQKVMSVCLQVFNYIIVSGIILLLINKDYLSLDVGSEEDDVIFRDADIWVLNGAAIVVLVIVNFFFIRLYYNFLHRPSK